MRLQVRIILAALILLPVMAMAKEPVGVLPKQPIFAVKTNLLYDLTTTFNVGFEFRLSKSLTLDLPVNCNPWTFSDNKKIKHWLIQPELRYWIYEPFNGHFLGVNALYSRFNVGSIPIPPGIRQAMGYGDIKNHRYQGDLGGIGISYGYHWMLSKRWSLESAIGAGYVRLGYRQFSPEVCGADCGWHKRNYFGLTKLGLSVIYMIK